MSHAATDERYLEIFPAWLRALGDDAAAAGALVAEGGAPEIVARYMTAALNYVFKSLDLIPDGIDDIGFLDDAFVLRVAASLAVHESGGTPPGGAIARLAADAASVRQFLGEDYVRLEAYVRALRRGAARGRTVDDVLGDAAARAAFCAEVTAWSAAYKTPSFTRDLKTLVKLKAFLGAKLA